MESTKNNWDSGLDIKQGLEVIVPIKLLLVCNSISNDVGDDEFSIVTSMEEEEYLKVRLSDNYYIPKQKVTPSSIEYLPDEFNHSVVIHRHPAGCLNFSRTDHEFINQNFELSLLYTYEKGFVNGLYNLKYQSGIIQLPVNISLDSGLEDIDISNIQKERISLKFLDDDLDFGNKSLPQKKNNGKTETNNEIIEELTTRLDAMEDFVFQGY